MPDSLFHKWTNASEGAQEAPDVNSEPEAGEVKLVKNNPKTQILKVLSATVVDTTLWAESKIQNTAQGYWQTYFPHLFTLSQLIWPYENDWALLSVFQPQAIEGNNFLLIKNALFVTHDNIIVNDAAKLHVEQMPPTFMAAATQRCFWVISLRFYNQAKINNNNIFKKELEQALKVKTRTGSKTQ